MTDDDTAPDTIPDPATAFGDAALSLDTVLELLANQRRRFALYTLIDTPADVVAIETLVEEVATLESAIAHEALTRERYLEIATDLYHWHLPVLADVGVVECDGRSGTIRYWAQSTLETWAGRVKRDEFRERDIRT